ncbi:DUF2357 domain-containing protein [Huintestinicola sp.]|uniref:DUF2357 domain-containing protein n=1 Tax=Huintestinicola sp. TaxID=2981661 RepID=UPI0015B6DB75
MNEAYSEWFEKFKDCTDQLDSDRLYESFRSSLSHSRSTTALNRRILEKDIDVSWVEAIETGLVSIDNVIRNPSKTITNVEEVVPIALSKKITVDSVKHLAQHTDLIQSVDPETGKITPSKVLNIHKEESYLTYENKFVNTLIDRLFIFVNKRYEKLKAVSSSEEVFAMEYNTAFESGSGRKMKMTLNIETSDSLEAADENGSTIWDRVEKIRRIVEGYKSSPFCQQMGQNYIRPPVMRTNAIMKNVDLKACLVLWQFIEGYDKTGYEINVSDSAQKPDKEYVENLYDLSALNLLLFRSFTQDSEAEVLKTQKSKAAAPRVLRKFDKVSYDEHELVIGGDRLTDDAALAQDNISENEKILAEIDKIIKIETEYYKAEEQKRLEAEEKERRRQEEERRIEEERRLAREKAEREEQERLEKARLEALRLEKERIESEEQERLERERIERERAELEEQKRLDAERDELEKMINAEMDKLETEKQSQKAEEERLRHEREEREKLRAEKLKEMRAYLEQKSFDEIYPEYSKNPIHVIRRSLRRLISLIRQDGAVIREGDSDDPKLIERIAAEAAAKAQAQRDEKEMAEMQVLYEKYTPNFRQRTRQSFKALFAPKRKKVYVMPAQMPVQRSPKEQRAYDRQMKELFRKYHVSFITKLIRKIKKEY